MKKGLLKALQDIKYRAKLKSIKKTLRSCGEGLKIYGEPRIVSPSNISLGDRVTLNDGCLLSASLSSIIIGNDVIVSADAKIMAATLETKSFILEHIRKHIKKEIYIGDNVWICAGAIICPGVHIKGSCVIAAGAIVTKDVDEVNVIVAGNPARVVKYLE